MAPAGYSGTPLLKKLGIKETTKVLLINAPDGYHDWLEQDIRPQLADKKGKADLVHLFVTSEKEFVQQMMRLKPLYQANTGLVIWVSWYKKSAGIPTDVTEDVIRNYALQQRLVDIKVCAVNEQWSGLKLVVPKAKR